MIFVTIGNHTQEFTRLIKKIDEIAPKIKEEVIIQRGHTGYIPKNCKSFQWAPSLEEYYKKARVVITHGGSSPWEFIYEYQKPIIIVPRQHSYNEHINDHQIEFSQELGKKTGVKVILNINELTPELLKKYRTIGKIDERNLKRLQKFLKEMLLCLPEDE